VGGGGSIEPPFDAANRLTTSVQSPCFAITACCPAFWLELKKLSVVPLVRCMDHINLWTMVRSIDRWFLSMCVVHSA